MSTATSTTRPSRKLIEKVTDAVVECTSEKIRDETWVVVTGLPPKQWGLVGKPLG